jgi:hypothetical protein
MSETPNRKNKRAEARRRETLTRRAEGPRQRHGES